MLLMPSILEPCGITQLIAMRYGTIPLVRLTGGLKDTVREGETGYTFEVPDNKGVANVLERSFQSFGSDIWNAMVLQAMSQNFSWEHSAEKYLDLYES